MEHERQFYRISRPCLRNQRYAQTFVLRLNLEIRILVLILFSVMKNVFFEVEEFTVFHPSFTLSQYVKKRLGVIYHLLWFFSLLSIKINQICYHIH